VGCGEVCIARKKIGKVHGRKLMNTCKKYYMKSGGSHRSLSPISLCEFAIGP
jgi:hypothetical protein